MTDLQELRTRAFLDVVERQLACPLSWPLAGTLTLEVFESEVMGGRHISRIVIDKDGAMQVLGRTPSGKWVRVASMTAAGYVEVVPGRALDDQMLRGLLECVAERASP